MRVVAAHRVVLLVLDDHRTGLCVADLEVDQRRAVVQRRAKHAVVDLERHAVVAAVHHAGHVALGAQALGGAGAALGPFFDFERWT